jgi:hypothetical protein
VPKLTLRAYGRTIELSGPPSALTTAQDRLPPTYRLATSPPERRWSVRRRARTVWTAFAEDLVLTDRRDIVGATEAVLSNLELWVAQQAKNHVFVHAACAVVDGRALVLPGRTKSGKSSLAAALVRAGATYFSDEYAVLDHRGLVRPYPRMLALRPYGDTVARAVSVGDIGGQAGRGPAAVAIVAALEFEPEAGWQVTPLSRGQALLRLLDNTVPARTRPRAALWALEHATAAITALSGTRGDADEAAALLLSMLSS